MSARRATPLVWKIAREMVSLRGPRQMRKLLKNGTALDKMRQFARIGGQIFPQQDGEEQLFYLAAEPTDRHQIGEYVYMRYRSHPGRDSLIAADGLLSHLHFRVHTDGSVYKDVLIGDNGQRAPHREKLAGQELKDFARIIDLYLKTLTNRSNDQGSVR
jgi:hypothetical protein